jgi:nucleoside-diphosphate-sugar epimerase
VQIALTGSTGFIGSHILTELRSHDHQVIALVRDDLEAASVAAKGATPAIIDLCDRPAVEKLFSVSDGAVHTASPGDETSVQLDSAVIDAAVEAFGHTSKPYAHIGGLWNFGSNTSITEESVPKPAGVVAWQPAILQRLLGTSGMRGIVVMSSIAYGDGGGGVPGVLLASPRDTENNLIMIGSGQQHWSTVHVADLAVVFRLVLEHDTTCGRYVVGNGLNPTVADLTEAAATAVGAASAVPGSDGEARSRLGDYLAEALLLDQASTATKARRVLGWQPTQLGLADEFRNGSYRHQQEASTTLQIGATARMM